MSISETISFDKEGRAEKSPWFKRLFLSILIILVASLAFGIGRLSGTSREAVRVEYDPSLTVKNGVQNTATAANAIPRSGEVVASKNGTKYHYSHCPGAKQIKEENKISFPTSQAAEASGYTLAGNCSPR